MLTTIAIIAAILIIAVALRSRSAPAKVSPRWWFIGAGLALVICLTFAFRQQLTSLVGPLPMPTVIGGIVALAILAYMILIARWKLLEIFSTLAPFALILCLVWVFNNVGDPAAKAAGCGKSLFQTNARAVITERPLFLRVCGNGYTYLNFPRQTSKDIALSFVDNGINEAYRVEDLFIVCVHGDTSAACRPNGVSPGQVRLVPREQPYRQAFGSVKTPVQIKAQLVDP